MSKSRLQRRSQTTSRRYQSKDQRDLSSVVRSYRKASLYQIQPSSGRTVSFWRKTQLFIPLNQSSGFGGLGNNINFGFSLGNIMSFTNGANFRLDPVPNASDFQNLFDYYCIKNVKMTLFFSRNTDPMTTAGSVLGMPLLQIANDFDDIAETMTAPSMNERVGCRHVQFDANNSNGISQYLKPKPNSVVIQTDVSSGAGVVSSAGVVMNTQWLDVAQSNIVHNGIKVFYNNQGVPGGTTLGVVSFIFDVEYCFKGYR